jgi:hypothetical protein
MQQIAQGGTPPTQTTGTGNRGVASISIERPSSRFRLFEQRDRFFRIEYPDNWRSYEPAQGKGATLAPEGGFVDAGGGRPDLVCGVIVNYYDPFYDDRDFGGNTSLARASNDLLNELMNTNPHLRPVSDSQRSYRLNGAPVSSVVLSGASPVTGQEERITVFTRELPDDHVIYALFIAPGKVVRRTEPDLQPDDLQPAGERAGGASIGPSTNPNVAGFPRSPLERIACLKLRSSWMSVC